METTKRHRWTFGQVVIGPPGSGKSTYCKAMQELCTSLGRQVAVVNLDPANDLLPYEAAVDISRLIGLREVMDSLKLGPNGGLVYCMEYLEANIEWLCDQLTKVSHCYLFIDCPGQVELYTHHESVRNVVSKLQGLGYRLSATHLVDSHYCSDPGKFISVLLTSLATMMHLELPHINVLSKVDLAEKYGQLHMGLHYYTDVMDLSFLVDVLSGPFETSGQNREGKWSHEGSFYVLHAHSSITTRLQEHESRRTPAIQEDPMLKRYKKLTEALAGVVEDYSLVSFLPLNVQDKESMWSVLKACDKSNGYIFSQSEEQHMMTLAMAADTQPGDTIARLRERLETSGTTCLVDEEAAMDETAPCGSPQ